MNLIAAIIVIPCLVVAFTDQGFLGVDAVVFLFGVIGPNSLPRGRSWPLNTHDVRAALRDLFDEVSLVWYSSASAGDLVRVTWNDDRSSDPRAFPADGAWASVWLARVDSDEAESAGRLLRETVLRRQPTTTSRKHITRAVATDTTIALTLRPQDRPHATIKEQR